MAVGFILGRAGSGKSRYCLDKVIGHLANEDSAPVVLLLPEQATYQAERAILADDRVRGYSNVHVLSFNRMQFRLAQISGRNAAGVELSRLGCEMVVQKILSQCAERLGVFGTVSKNAGTAKQMAAMITALHQSNISAEEIKAAAEKLAADKNTILAGMKMADICRVYEKYEEFFESVSGEMINPDKRLADAVKDVNKAEFLKGAMVYVDGFASFTKQEIELLVEVVKHSNETAITLCMDPTGIELVNPDVSGLDPVSMFSRTERTYVDLVGAMRAAKVKIAAPVLLNKIWRFNNETLGHIEKYCFGEEVCKYEKKAPDPFIFCASDPRAEVEAIARKIIELVKERRWRFRDVAVVASNLDEYEHYIISSFADHRIPLFLDRGEAMSSHPAAELITAAIKAACSGMETTDVIAYLKTDLGPLDRETVDVLENYCLAYGVDGNDWWDKQQWRYATSKSGFDQKKIDAARKMAAGPLGKLNKKLTGEISAKEFVKAVFEFIEELGVREKLAQWETDQAGGIHQQFYNRLMDVFDEMTRVFADDIAGTRQYAAMLAGALKEMKLKLIPQKLDQVLVGSIERSRHPELKAIFLAGTNQKHFPAPIASGALLSEEDNEAASQAGVEIGDSLIQRLSARQYLAYIAFTRASEYLYISYTQNDSGGKSHVLSPLAGELLGMFEGCEIQKVQGRTAAAGTISDDVCRLCGAESGLEKNEAMKVADKLGDENIEAGKILQAALSYDNGAEIDTEKLKKAGAWYVKDGVLKCSTSRLRDYAECAYKHFAGYMLRLKDRKLSKLEAVDMGDFYHRVIDGVSKGLIQAGVNFASAEDSLLEELCNKEAGRIIEEDSLISNYARRGGLNNYVIMTAVENVTEAVKGYAKGARAGVFRLYDSEVKFGFEAGKAECEFVLKDTTTVRLRGVIDRIDTAKIDGKVCALIFDYKLNKRTVSYGKLANRIDMQLPIYMLAVKTVEVDGEKIEDVAGAFYLPVQVKHDDGDLETFDKGEGKFKYKAYGIFDGDRYEELDAGVNGWSEYYNFYKGQKDGAYGNFANSGAVKSEQLEKILEFTQDSIVGLAEEIVDGSISVRPYRMGKVSPCGWCGMRAVCRFDWQVNSYNVMGKPGKSEWLEELGAEL